jgi:hypothetical protein
MLVGAPSYISPERARGHKPGPAADLWSLGGLLYAAVEGTPPYDKGSAIATLTAVMTEPLEEPKNAGPLRDVIYGLLTKDPAQRLDDAGARAMLKAVINAPDRAEPEPADATKVVPLPAQPDAPATGGKRGEEAAERLRGALRSARKAAVGTGVSAAGRATSGPGTGTPAAGSAPTTQTPGPSGAANGGANGRSSGWPVMTPPPDMPPRPVPRAPLTDVVPRRTLVVIAVAVVVAVLGVVLALTLGGDDDGTNRSKGTGNTAAAGAGSEPGTKADPSGGVRTDGSATGSAASTPDGTPDTTASGDGAGGEASSGKESGKETGKDSASGSGKDDDIAADSTHQGRQGYSIGLPEGWKYRSSDAAGDRFTGPDGQKLLIGWTSTPKDDPVADWKNQERYMVRAQYDRIRIEKVDYRGWNTADWEFTYVDGGTKYRTIDRGFVVDDDQGYALMYTAKAAKWDGELRRITWRTLTKTFEPKA